MNQYLNLMRDILDNGYDKGDRTGTGTRSVFGRQLRFDLSESFPLLTTKQVHIPSIVEELLWFLSGSTNNNDLLARGVRIWNEWACEDGSLGPIYGQQWVNWRCPDGTTVNQIQGVIDQLKSNPNTRRAIVSAWNPADLPDESVSPQENVVNGKAALPPCHTLFQFYARELSMVERTDLAGEDAVYEYHCELNSKGHYLGYTTLTDYLDFCGVPKHELSCQLYQRSCDYVLGAPFNIASYSLLTAMIADQCNMVLGEFVFALGDVHLYRDHIEDETIVKEQLSRAPRNPCKLVIKRTPPSIFEYTADDFEFIGYDPHPPIKAKVSV